jgi:hypothetical protein
MHDDTTDAKAGSTIQSDWDSLIQLCAIEIVEMICRHHVVGDDDQERIYYNAHQMLTGRDFGKLVLNRLAHNIGVGV